MPIQAVVYYNRYKVSHLFPSFTLSKISLLLSEEHDVTEHRVVYATENNSTFLECVPRSPQASLTWLVQRDDRKEEVRRCKITLFTTTTGPVYFTYCMTLCLCDWMVRKLWEKDEGRNETSGQQWPE